MASEKIFFSYSRTDSTFVLKLAKDLRDSGIALWLDQLDIKAGSHWDSSIQDALTATRILIVVLSKASVKSENVMDEVSFALEQDKTIIPVIINDCTPPFRLMRLQRLDFIGDYQTGLNQLLETINQISASNEVAGNDPGAGNSAQSEKRETPGAGHDENRSHSEADKKDKELDRLLWESAKKANTLAAYKHYSEEFPRGMYIDNALAAIKKISENESHEELLVSKNAVNAINDGEKKGNAKKYTLYAGGVFVIAMAIWGIMQLNQNSNKSIAETNKKIEDSIKLVNTIKQEKDSAEKVQQAALAKARKDSIKLGNDFGGGIIYYIDATGEHGLIMAQGDQNGQRTIKWYDGKIEKIGAYGAHIYQGKKNTELIVSKLGEGTYPAKICADCDLGGYNDWYLPSKDELDEMYNYDKKKNAGFTDDYYWSSTELPDADVYYRSFYNGQPFIRFGTKKQPKVRAIRSF